MSAANLIEGRARKIHHQVDVARYKYPPAWVKAEDLWQAMNTEDADARAKRGFVIVSRGQQ